MIVDCHTHLKSSTSIIEEAEFFEALERVDAAIVLSLPDVDCETSNKQVMDVATKTDKIIGFAAVDPIKEQDPAKAVIKAKEIGHKGIVLHCPATGLHPTHSKAMLVYEAAQQEAMPVYFHSSGPYNAFDVLDFAQPYLLDEVARSFPELKLVIGSMGLPFVFQSVALLQKHANVFSCLTVPAGKPWQLYNTVMSAFEGGVMDKILFGSGYPSGDVNESVEALLGFNRMLANSQLPNVPRDEIRKIVERDSLSLLGL